MECSDIECPTDTIFPTRSRWFLSEIQCPAVESRSTNRRNHIREISHLLLLIGEAVHGSLPSAIHSVYLSKHPLVRQTALCMDRFQIIDKILAADLCVFAENIWVLELSISVDELLAPETTAGSWVCGMRVYWVLEADTIIRSLTVLSRSMREIYFPRMSEPPALGSLYIAEFLELLVNGRRIACVYTRYTLKV